MLGIVLLAAASVAASAAPSRSSAREPPLHCPGDNTLEINDCLGAELAKAEAVLKRYIDAARKRLKSEAADDPGAAAALVDLDKTQTAWLAYRGAECDSVYDYWQAGTIRTSMEITCEIDLTRRRTHQVWSEWLTYMDSTPPILPEPSTKPAP